MKRRIMLAVLLAVVTTATVEGHRHNAEALPESLADSLGSAKFAKGGSLWSDQGDLLLSSTFERAVGHKQIADALQRRYGGSKIELVGSVHAWPAGEGTDTAGIALVNWVYQVSKGSDSHKDLFVAIARQKKPHDQPVDVNQDQAYRFVTVRVVSLPLPSEY
jgi:hypothetical protein